MSWEWYRRESSQRRPGNGIRAQTQSGQFGKTWWAGKWLDALERLVDSARLGRGRSYARSGQVLNIDIQPGRVDARVQGSRAAPYKVQISIKPLPSADWQRVADAMAAQAIFAAKLLAGEMPQEIEQAFAAAKINLFPVAAGDLQTDCSCPDYANPCKHVAAVYYLLGEQFDADPFLLFRLRGKTKEDLIAMLRARRTTAQATQTAIQPAAGQALVPVAQEPVAPLEDALERFWDSPTDLDELRISIERPPVDAAPVKRLGEPAFRLGRDDVMACFTALYRSVSDAVLADVTTSESS
jgi:uncharacterized Zn finger protein